MLRMSLHLTAMIEQKDYIDYLRLRIQEYTFLDESYKDGCKREICKCIVPFYFQLKVANY